MRVLFLNECYPPDVAATSYVLGELAESLADHHTVEVLCGRPSYNPEAGPTLPHGVRVIRAWSTGFHRRSMTGRLTNYATFLASAVVHGRRVSTPDIVVAMTDPPLIGTVGLRIARRFGVPFVQVYQDLFPDVAVALGKLRNQTAVRAWSRLNRRVRSGADKIVAIGRDMADRLESQGVHRDKIAFIPNWSSSTEPDPRAAAHARASMGLDGRFVVMHAGNIGLAQNLTTAIDAADRLRSIRDLVLVFLGDGAEKAAVEQEAEKRGLDNVRFFPYIPKDQVEPFMQAADVHLIALSPGLGGCAVPSKMYGIMAAGRPFVAAVDEASEPARVIEEHGCGVRIRPGDGAALAQTLRQMITLPLDDMGAKGRAAYLHSYGRSDGTARYRALLEEVVASRAERIPKEHH